MRPRDPGWWVWAEALDLLQGGEHVQRRFFMSGTLRAPPCWEPSVDLYERGDELTLLVALPGVSAGQFEVVLDAAALVVRGERPIPPAIRGAAIHRIEIPYGRFERRVTFPPGNFRLLAQSLKDGCLTLVLRRS